MHLIETFIQIILHLDDHLQTFLQVYGAWAYLALFLIIFCETGLVFFPFLPGDSLLFAAGAITARQNLSLPDLMVLLSLAAMLGDQVNYWIGRKIGHWLIHLKDAWYFKKAYLKKTHDFYERYGGKTLIIARFVPIVRTFAPFAAGLSEMTYWRFCSFSVCGGLFWVVSLTICGYIFGNLPFIRNHFTLIVLAIIFISLLPGIYHGVRGLLKRSKTA